MPIDYPDFFRNDSGGLRPTLQDMGELAARLGSQVTYSRTGQVFNFWTGARGLSGLFMLEGVAGTITLVSTPSFLSGYSARLNPNDTDPNNYDVIAIYSQPFAIDKYGAEVCLSVSATYDRFELTLGLVEGGQYYYSAIRFTPVDSKWYYYNSAGAWVHFHTQKLADSANTELNFVKLTVDFPNAEYVRLDIGDEFADMEGIAINISATTAGDVTGMGLWAYNDAGDTGSVYVHHMILTNGEP